MDGFKDSVLLKMPVLPKLIDTINKILKVKMLEVLFGGGSEENWQAGSKMDMEMQRSGNS